MRHRHRDWRDSVTAEGCLGPPGAGSIRKDPLLEALEGAQPCDTSTVGSGLQSWERTDFRCSPPACGQLWWPRTLTPLPPGLTDSWSQGMASFPDLSADARPAPGSPMASSSPALTSPWELQVLPAPHRDRSLAPPVCTEQGLAESSNGRKHGPQALLSRRPLELAQGHEL